MICHFKKCCKREFHVYCRQSCRSTMHDTGRNAGWVWDTLSYWVAGHKVLQSKDLGVHFWKDLKAPSVFISEAAHTHPLETNIAHSKGRSVCSSFPAFSSENCWVLRLSSAALCLNRLTSKYCIINTAWLGWHCSYLHSFFLPTCNQLIYFPPFLSLQNKQEQTKPQYCW